MIALPTSAIGWAANLLLPVAVVALCTCCARSASAGILLASHAQRLERDLRYLQRPWPAQSALHAHGMLFGVTSATAAILGCWPALILPVAAAFAPGLWLARARRARTARIDAQLDTWLVVLSNSLRATASLGHAIDASATRISAPLADELRLTLNEMRLGAPLDHALDALGERVQSATLHATLSMLRVARSSGGDLSATLDNAAASLREMARLDGVIRSKTAEGRAQSLLIALIPAPLCALLDALSPTLLTPLWSTARGHLVLGCAVMLWLSALLMARKITAVEV